MNGRTRVFSMAVASACLAVLAHSPASAGVAVTPVNIQLLPGENAAALTIRNDSDRKMSFQIRGYSWQQDSLGNDTLTPTDQLLSSPPLATVQPGGSQVVRIILNNPRENREETYRIIFDQLPPPNETGVVHVLVRLSIPIFAEPQMRVAPQVRWRVTKEAGRWWLSATNSGSQHLTVRNMRLETFDGRQLQIQVNSPPHILAGATRRWPIVANAALSPKEVLRLTGSADLGVIEQRISADAGP